MKAIIYYTGAGLYRAAVRYRGVIIAASSDLYRSQAGAVAAAWQLRKLCESSL